MKFSKDFGKVLSAIIKFFLSLLLIVAVFNIIDEFDSGKEGFQFYSTLLGLASAFILGLLRNKNIFEDQL